MLMNTASPRNQPRAQRSEISMSILVIDDATIIRNRFVSMLRMLGCDHSIQEAGTVAEGLELLRQTRPDIILLDVHLPDGNGIDVLRQIKAERPEVTVAMFTNYPFAEHRRRCIEAGADYFFDKSNEFEEAVTTVNALSLTL